MLERWAAENVSQEPDWDVEALERVQFSGRLEAAAGTRAAVSADWTS